MPYTKSEIEKLDFYTEFRDGLRNEYLNRMSASAENNFRDENNVLYSYEDIFTTLGSETIRVSTDGIYKNYVSQEEIDNSKSVNNLSYPVYNLILPDDKPIDQSNLTSKLIDRNISELAQDTVGGALPKNIINGNVVTNEDPLSQDRWLIEDGQKREFRNVGEFYGLGKTLSQLISLSEADLTSIPDGEPIE